MKQGITFESLVTQVETQTAERYDFYTATNDLKLSSEGGTSRLQMPQGEFGVRETAHLHLAELTGIDRRYYQRLRSEAAELLDDNVNHWLAKSGTKPRLVRSLGTEVRAIASSRYATLDNDALLQALEPVMADLGATVESCHLNDECLTLKLVTPKLEGEVAKGDIVQAGLVIRNSEVRAGALSVQPLIFRCVCSNGLILGGANGNAISRRHIGRDWRDHANPFGAVLQNNAEREAWERDIWSQLQTNLRAAITTDGFADIIDRLKAATRFQTTLEPHQVVERLGELGPTFRLGPELQSQIIRHLEDEGWEGNFWNLINGITRAAQGVSGFEFSTSLEQLAGQLASSPHLWERLTSPN